MTFDLTRLTTTPDLSFKPAGDDVTASAQAAFQPAGQSTPFDHLLASYAQPAPPEATPAAPPPAQTAQAPQAPQADHNDTEQAATQKSDSQTGDGQSDPATATASGAPTKSTPSSPARKDTKAAAATAGAAPPTAAAPASDDATQKAGSLLAGLISVMSGQPQPPPTAAAAGDDAAKQLAVQSDGQTGQPASGQPVSGKSSAAKPGQGQGKDKTAPADPLGDDDDGDDGPGATATADAAKAGFNAALEKLQNVRDLASGQDKGGNSQTADQNTPLQTLTLPVTDTTQVANAQAFSLTPAPGTTAATYTAQAAATGSTLSQTAVDTLSSLSLQISKRLDAGATKFTLELHPADLGRVDVALTIGIDGKTSAHLSFDSPVTASAFKASEGELRDQLAQTGLTVSSDGLSFTSKSDAPATATDSFSQYAGSQNPGQGASQSQQDQPHRNAPVIAHNLTPDASADADIDAWLSGLSNRSSSGSLALNLLV